MTIFLNINNTNVPTEDIKKYPKSEEKLFVDDLKIVPDTVTFTLDNTEKELYDDRYPGSLFYGSTFYGDDIELYDDEKDYYLFKGLLKKYTINESAAEVEIEATNYIKSLADITCIYNSTTNVTPAAIVYEILTDSALGNIDTSNIIYAGFRNAINIQDAAGVYVNCVFTAEDAKTCLDVCQELLRISGCHLYTFENKIYMWQWQAYAGAIGARITKRDILTKQYKHYFDDRLVWNYYYIAWDDGGTVAWASGSDATSILRYGERRFNVPDESVDSTSSADFKIIFKTQAAAAWAGALILSRFKNMAKYLEITVGDDHDYHKITDQLDLDGFDNFVREPVLIHQREYDRDKKTIKLKCIFANEPYEYYSRDETPPDAPQLIAAIPMSDSSILLRFTEDQSSDHLGYKIYFTSTAGEWQTDICDKGQSPIDAKITALTYDGYVYIKIYQLHQGTEYFFKVTAYDTSFNESEFSNVLSATPATVYTDVNLYNLTENYSIDLDSTNSENGSVLTGYSKYSDGNKYGSDTFQPCSFFVSALFYKRDGFTEFSWRGYGDANDIQYQYRCGDSVAGLSAWSTLTDAIGNFLLTGTYGKYFQYRLVFNSLHWSDGDSFMIKTLR